MIQQASPTESSIPCSSKSLKAADNESLAEKEGEHFADMLIPNAPDRDISATSKLPALACSSPDFKAVRNLKTFPDSSRSSESLGFPDSAIYSRSGSIPAIFPQSLFFTGSVRPDFGKSDDAFAGRRNSTIDGIVQNGQKSFYDSSPLNILPRRYSESSVLVGVSSRRRKPALSYASMLVQVFEMCGNRLMTLTEIYDTIMRQYPYFRTAPPGWKNSVRHNLSLHPFFARVARPPQYSGKGSFWHLATGGPDEVPKKAAHVANTLPRDLHTVINRMPYLDNASQRPSFENTTEGSAFGSSEMSKYVHEADLFPPDPASFPTAASSTIPYETSLSDYLDQSNHINGYNVAPYPSLVLASSTGRVAHFSTNSSPFREDKENSKNSTNQTFEYVGTLMNPRADSLCTSSSMNIERTWRPIQRLHDKTLEHQQQHDLLITLSSPSTPPLVIPNEPPLLLPDSDQMTLMSNSVGGYLAATLNNLANDSIGREFIRNNSNILESDATNLEPNARNISESQADRQQNEFSDQDGNSVMRQEEEENLALKDCQGTLDEEDEVFKRWIASSASPLSGNTNSSNEAAGTQY